MKKLQLGNNNGNQPEDKNAFFIHDVMVSYQTIYPMDLNPQAVLCETIDSFKGSAKLADLKQILGTSKQAGEIFTNLFWMYFCLKFQRQAYVELKREYKRVISEHYATLFYSLQQVDKKEKDYEKEVIRGRLRRIPIIFAWAIIRKFHTTFKKSIVEYNAKFVTKCCQVVMFELQGLCVTEAFVISELGCLIHDPILYDTFPNLKPYKARKAALASLKNTAREEEPAEPLELDQFKTEPFKNVWRQYTKETKHSKNYFDDQAAKVNAILGATQKRVELLESRVFFV